jgi:alpha-glucosidase
MNKMSMNTNILKASLLTLLACFAVLFCGAQGSRLSIQTGNFRSMQKVAHGVDITATNARIELRVYAPAVIRVREVKDTFPADFSYAVITKPAGNFTSVKNGSDRIVLQTDSLEVRVQKNPLRIDFYNRAGKWLNGDDKNLGVSWLGNKVMNYQQMKPEERFIGLGEKTGNLDRRGSHYVNWNEDNYGYGVNKDPLYATMPFFVGIHDSTVFGLFFDNTYKSFFNFGASTDDKMYYFGAEDGVMNYYFFGASTVAGIINNYTSLTGRIKMPPLWSLGYQQSRYSYMSQREVLDVAGKLREDSIPADVIYCDIDYMDHYKIFTWNPTTFPDPRGMNDKLKQLNFHLVTIIDPGIKIEDGYKPYMTGKANDFFARYPGGRFYTGSVWAGRSHFPDFTKAAVRHWWGEDFKILTDNGVTGFWNDMNEPSAWGQDIPPLIEFGQRDTTATLERVRNIYGLEMARATYEGTRRLMDGQRPFVLTRAAYSGIQRYSAMWTGDNNPTDEHMLLGFRLINSLGLCGESYVGMDVGGFTGDPTPALMVRWMSLGVFTPMFRNHTGKNNMQHEPWVWGEDNLKLMRGSVDLRYALLPYLYSTFYESHETGMPINRTLAIQATYNPDTYDPAYQEEFLFGDNMLVAPVASTAILSKVFLPRGQWYRMSSEQQYKGDSVYVVNSSLDDLPVFIKAGAIIPMQNVIQSTADKGDGILKLNVWYGKKGSSFIYYEDDGSTYKFQKGDYYKREIVFDPSAKQIILEKPEGSYRTKFSRVELVLHQFTGTASISINHQTLKLKSAGKPGVFTALFDNDASDKMTISCQ